MLSPKRIKYRKKQRGTRDAVAHKGNQISFGEYGLMALEPYWITNRQIEAARVAMTRHVKRGGKVWIRIFPDMPYTKKPAETRQGNGKGAPEGWVAVVKTGAIMLKWAESMRLWLEKLLHLQLPSFRSRQSSCPVHIRSKL